MPVTINNVGDVVMYHAATEDQIESYGHIRDSAEHFISTILINTPQCADQAAAIRKVREAMMTANAAIALKGLV